MNAGLSANAQAILLLTAPLIAGRSRPSANPLSAAEYRRLTRGLRERGHQPADLLDSGSSDVLKGCGAGLDLDRLERLLGRGFLLSQAVERWQARAIRVVSRADAGYPSRLKTRLREEAPPVLYSCGDTAILDAGGLAIVGSRNVDERLIDYTEKVGRLVAAARRAVVSGGARGIDRAAMHGAMDAGGRAVGVLPDGLERAAMRREHREMLMDGRLALISPYDPAARFHIGHAMQRNKLIYALSDAALVVDADYEKGGTWAGAVEQLDRLKFIPVYVRTAGETGRGLQALRGHGALQWPDPDAPAVLEALLGTAPGAEYGSGPEQRTLMEGFREESAATPKPYAETDSASAGKPFAEIGKRIERMDAPTVAAIAEAFQVTRKQAAIWLKRFMEGKARQIFVHSDACMTTAEVAEALRISRGRVPALLKRLIEDGSIEKLQGSRLVRYRCRASIGSLFDR